MKQYESAKLKREIAKLKESLSVISGIIGYPITGLDIERTSIINEIMDCLKELSRLAE